MSALNFPLLSPNCFCWNILCIFWLIFSTSSVHGVLSEISVTVTACFNLLCLSMIIRLHKFVAVLLRNNETFEYRGNTNMRFYPENCLNCQQKCSSASLSKNLLAFSGCGNIFTVTSLQPLFKIPDLAVSTVTHHQILRSSAVGPRPSLSLSIVRADRSHHIVTRPPPQTSSAAPLSEISSISPGLRSRTCLFCLCVMRSPDGLLTTLGCSLILSSYVTPSCS